MLCARMWTANRTTFSVLVIKQQIWSYFLGTSAVKNLPEDMGLISGGGIKIPNGTYFFFFQKNIDRYKYIKSGHEHDLIN